MAVVDYSSLYPSCMISDNISHDTKVWTKEYDLENNLILINGNQLMTVVFNYLLNLMSQSVELNNTYFIASTIVSSPIISRIANQYNVECKLSLTGFKWIAKMIEDHPDEKFLGGGEESFGFMVGDFVRDKDAVTAALLACEVASTAMSNGESFFDQLLKAYKTFGLYQEKLISFIKKGKEGVLEIQQMMENLRKSPPKQIGGERIKTIEDFKVGVQHNCIEDKKETITLPKSDVLIFTTEDGAKIAVRPSGTEPKIKFYFSVNSPLKNQSEYQDLRSDLNEKIERMCGELGLTA